MINSVYYKSFINLVFRHQLLFIKLNFTMIVCRQITNFKMFSWNYYQKFVYQISFAIIDHKIVFADQNNLKIISFLIKPKDYLFYKIKHQIMINLLVTGP